MKMQIYSTNEWLYPDCVVTKEYDENEQIRISSAKNAYAGIQILFNGLQNGHMEITALNMPDCITLERYKLIDVLVEKNTGPVCFCAKDDEDPTPYTTRKAPFRVYDAISPYIDNKTEINNGTEAVYLAFKTDITAKAGLYDIHIKIRSKDTERDLKISFRIYNVSIPEKGTLYISNWFGVWQMSAQHHVDMWSEEHWQIIKKYAEIMRRTRQTHFLIPKETICAKKEGEGTYSFDFTNTKRLIEMFLSLGFTRIEGSLIAYRMDFWDDTFVLDAAEETVPALSETGYDYISQYLTAWRKFLEDNGWLDILHQHVADEPIPACANEYRILSGIVRKYLPGVPIMDAVEMSDLDGAVDIWIPKNSWYAEHMEEFERKRKNGDSLWFYTCCYPGGFYLNRLWDMPLIRTRLLHTANYRYDMEGYLHWGLNFCDTNKDPFNQTDIYFPPGDTHITYPGDNAPLSSMRLEMMRQGVEDYELLKLLEKENKPAADKIAYKWLPAFDKANEDIADFEKGREELLSSLERSMYFKTKTVSALTKVFPNEKPLAERYSNTSALSGEKISYQIVYKSKYRMNNIGVKLNTDIAGSVSLFKVGLVTCELPNYEDHDDYLLRTEPGLYPDTLKSFDRIDALPEQYHSIWVYIDTKDVQAGNYSVEIEFINQDNQKTLGKEVFELEVLQHKLPVQKLIHTEWFYMDCLATMYGVDVFSDEHKEIVENYVEDYANHGMNMILTPIFSPPIEMDFGGDRLTVQLVDVKKDGESYTFDFNRLSWFIEMCREKGIVYFEFAHLYTQWGAAYSPKIFAEIDGEQKQIFGWDVRGDSEAYISFVKQYLVAADSFIKSKGLQDYVFLHISDEPNLSCMESYKKASDTVKSLKLTYPVIDALSDYEFYKNGFLDRPVSSTECINAFLENNTKNLWAYYCCCEYKNGLSNRFMNMPGERTRVIGFQLYKHNINGFLHWGYNHWYSGRSRIQNLDPYKVTDSAHCFPAGDAFLVYPGDDKKPVHSIRLMLIEQAMQDIRACQALENLSDRETVLAVIEKDEPITFTNYPHSPEWILRVRNDINEQIKKYTITN